MLSVDMKLDGPLGLELTGDMDPSALMPALNDFTQHHPCWSTWDWWFDEWNRNTKQENWLEGLKPVGTFDTVE
eukprot:gene23432-9690_t